MKPRGWNLLGSIVVGLSISGCAGLPPSRICASAPPGSFSAFPADWCATDGKEHMPAVDNAGIALAAKLSYLAYQPDSQIEALGEVRIGEVGIDPEGQFPRLFGTKYFIWHDTTFAGGPRQYLSIRGTANFENIFEDANYPKILDPELGIWVHRGYYSIAREILQSLRDRPLPADEPVWVTGHSLGGGVALLVYLHLCHDGVTLGPLYTFGQPRTIAQDAWAPYSCLPIVRVVNFGDFVPLVPPTMKDKGCDKPLDPGCNGSYVQLGDEVLLTEGGGCEYRTYHDPNAIGYGIAKTLLEDAEHKELKKYLLVHLPERYLENTRPLADDPGFACGFRPRP
jgi:hypothetical protein